MKNILYKFFTKQASQDVGSLARTKLRENQEVLQSLKDYDEGRKTISTSRIDKHLLNI